MRIAICDDNPQDIERIKRYQTVVSILLLGIRIRLVSQSGKTR